MSKISITNRKNRSKMTQKGERIVTLRKHPLFASVFIGLLISVSVISSVVTSVVVSAADRVGVGVQLTTGVYPYNSYMVNTAKRGDTIHHIMSACNGGTVDSRYQFHSQVAAWTASGGKITNDPFTWWVGPPVVDSWTTMSPSDAVLLPGKCQTINVTIAVPANAPLGAHGAVAWATSVPLNYTGTISQAVGAGIREYLTVAQ